MLHAANESHVMVTPAHLEHPHFPVQHTLNHVDCPACEQYRASTVNRRYFAPKMKKMVRAVDKVAVDPAPTLKLIAFPGNRK